MKPFVHTDLSSAVSSWALEGLELSLTLQGQIAFVGITNADVG